MRSLVRQVFHCSYDLKWLENEYGLCLFDMALLIV